MSNNNDIRAIQNLRAAYLSAKSPVVKAQYRKALVKRARKLKYKLVLKQRKANQVVRVPARAAVDGTPAAARSAAVSGVATLDRQIATVDAAVVDPAVSTDTKAALLRSRAALSARRQAVIAMAAGRVIPPTLGSAARRTARVALVLPATPVWPSPETTSALFDVVASKVEKSEAEPSARYRLRLWGFMRRAITRLTQHLTARAKLTPELLESIATETVTQDAPAVADDALQGGIDGSDQAGNAADFLVASIDEDLDAEVAAASSAENLTDTEIDLILLDAEDDAPTAAEMANEIAVVPDLAPEATGSRRSIPTPYLIAGAVVVLGAGYWFFGRQR